MFHLPDLRPLFFFAIIGFAASVIGGVAAIGWAGLHLFRALKLYMGF